MRNALLWAMTLAFVAIGWVVLFVGGTAIESGFAALAPWITQNIGWGGNLGFLVILIGGGATFTAWANRRDARRRYVETKTIDGSATRISRP